MNRVVNIILVVLMIVGAGLTYDLKHRAQDTARRVARLNNNIAKEKEAIAELKAEWSMLSQPARLQALVAKYQDHFRLEPFAAAQMAGLAELPTKEAGAVPDVQARAVAEATTTH